jgi:hypothetical protein
MPRYEPIDVGFPIKASLSDISDFAWSTVGVRADFLIPEDDRYVLRVVFDQQCIVRLLDEMALSTETENGQIEGLVPDHFAYRLHDAVFARTQSEAWKLTMRQPISHYRFVTGWICLDVLSAAAPAFAKHPLPGGRR